MRLFRLTAFAILFATTAGCVTHENILTGDKLHHGDLKLSVTKLPDWRFLTPAEKRAAKFANTYRNKAVEYGTKQSFEDARIVIAKYPEPKAGLNPHVSIDRLPLNESRFESGPWIVNYHLRNLQSRIDGIEVVEPTRTVTVAGRPAGYLRLRFVLETKAGPPLRIDYRLWAIANGISYFGILAIGAQDGPDFSETELTTIVNTIAFDQPVK